MKYVQRMVDSNWFDRVPKGAIVSVKVNKMNNFPINFNLVWIQFNTILLILKKTIAHSQFTDATLIRMDHVATMSVMKLIRGAQNLLVSFVCIRFVVFLYLKSMCRFRSIVQLLVRETWNKRAEKKTSKIIVCFLCHCEACSTYSFSISIFVSCCFFSVF